MSARTPDPESLGDDLLRAVARVNRWASHRARFDISPAQARLLSLVEELGPSRVNVLAEADHCTQPTMSAQIQRLETLGWLTRTADPDDRRASVVALSPAGADALAGVRRARVEAVAPLLHGLSTTTLERLADAVDAMTELLDLAAPTAAPHRKD